MSTYRVCWAHLQGRPSHFTGLMGVTVALLITLFAATAAASTLSPVTEGGESYTSTTAILNGSVDTKNQQTYYGFEYGPTTAYGNETSGGHIDVGTVTARESIADLKANTTYHYRFVAYTFVGGTYVFSHGLDETVTTPAAHVPRFEAERYLATLNGAQDAGSPHLLTLGGRTYECEAVNFQGAASNTVSQISLAAEYAGCRQSGSPATILVTSMHSCNYVLSVGTGGPPYAGALGIACSEPGDSIEMSLYENQTKLNEGKTLCVNTIGPQAGIPGVNYETAGKASGRSVEASLHLESLEYSVIKGGKVLCKGLGTYKNGIYSGGSTITGVNKGSSDGLYIAGE